MASTSASPSPSTASNASALAATAAAAVEHHIPHEHFSPLTAAIALALVVAVGAVAARAAATARTPVLPMPAMVAAGLLLRMLFPSLIEQLPRAVTAPLAAAALAAVVARAGLAADASSLAASARPAVLIGALPVLAEAAAAALIAHSTLGLPLSWAAALAFGVASISPGVVVPLLLTLSERPLWRSSRLPPLMLAALGIDVLIATTGFGVALASALGHAHEHAPTRVLDSDPLHLDLHHDAAPPPSSSVHAFWIDRVIEELVAGIAIGSLLAALAFVLIRIVRIPESRATPTIFICSAVVMIWAKAHGFIGASSCATILAWSALANIYTRADAEAADARLKSLWTLLKLFLFPVIGASLSFSDMPISLFLKTLAIVLFSVTIKFVTCYMAARIARLSHGEAAFICGLWTGKASVQATLCHTALEIVHLRGLDNSPQEHYARIVFCAMVAAIFIGIPSAAGWASLYGHHPPAPSGKGVLRVQTDKQPMIRRKDSTEIVSPESMLPT